MSNETVILGHEGGVAKTAKMLLLEQKHGKLIDEVIIEAYNRHGFKGACKSLGIAGNTLAAWSKRFDIVFYHGAAKRETLERLNLNVEPRKQVE